MTGERNSGDTPNFDKLQGMLPKKEDTLVHSREPQGYVGWLDAGIDAQDAMWLQLTFRREAQGPDEEADQAQRRRLEQFKGEQN